MPADSSSAFWGVAMLRMHVSGPRHAHTELQARGQGHLDKSAAGQAEGLWLPALSWGGHCCSSCQHHRTARIQLPHDICQLGQRRLAVGHHQQH